MRKKKLKSEKEKQNSTSSITLKQKGGINRG
jgi:hypothetical protein